MKIPRSPDVNGISDGGASSGQSVVGRRTLQLSERKLGVLALDGLAKLDRLLRNRFF